MEQPRPERTTLVAPDEQINATDVVGLQDDRDRRRSCIKPFPYLVRIVNRRERVQHKHLTLRFHASGGHERIP